MSKNVKFAITGSLAVLMLGGIIWFGINAKKAGSKCRFCGETFPHENISFHQVRCPKNNVNMQFDQTGK